MNRLLIQLMQLPRDKVNDLINQYKEREQLPKVNTKWCNCWAAMEDSGSLYSDNTPVSASKHTYRVVDIMQVKDTKFIVLEHTKNSSVLLRTLDEFNAVRTVRGVQLIHFIRVY